jgi:inositol 1,4,5-triphosphate receptor type 1
MLSLFDDHSDDEEKNRQESKILLDVGHNIYILCHKLAKFNREMSTLLKSKDNLNDEAMQYYSVHTGQIEIIREDRSMEQIVFPVPTLCEYLTEETKQRVFLTTEKDEHDSKIEGFFDAVDSMWTEMKWQRKLRKYSSLYYLSSNMSFFGDVSFNLSLLLNLIVAFFYPFEVTFKGKFFLSFFIFENFA